MPNNSRVPHHPAEGCDSSICHPKIDTKRLGEVAELAFLLKATSLGLTPARPYGDRRPYDFLLECGRRVLKIQVKSASVSVSNKPECFSVTVAQHKDGGRAAYTAEDIDFVVAYLVPHDTWYVIPVKVLNHRKMVTLYPLGKKRTYGGFFEKYREAWHLLRPRRNGRGG